MAFDFRKRPKPDILLSILADIKSWLCSYHNAWNSSLASDPAELGIEVLPFEPEIDSQLLLHLLARDIAADVSGQEVKSA